MVSFTKGMGGVFFFFEVGRGVLRCFLKTGESYRERGNKKENRGFLKIIFKNKYLFFTCLNNTYHS
jgi:hypothetical protein